MTTYRHYEGGTCRLIAGALRGGTEEPFVVYRDLETYQLWVLPEEEFSGYVTIDGQRVRRFEEVLNGGEDRAVQHP